MIIAPYHHIKGVFAPEESSGVPDADRPGRIAWRAIWLK
jgi:hypothetical protein